MYDRKCIDGDSDHQTSTGIQRHRLRALFERDAGGTADNLNYSPRNTIIVFRGFSFFIRGAPDQKKE